jgi:nicotinate-nucleotide pyrophosphorylase (carboxylating)
LIIPPPIDSAITTLIELAVTEDLGVLPNRPGDITVQVAIPGTLTARSQIVARAGGVLAGLFLVPSILAHYNPKLTFSALAHDGDAVAPGQKVGVISGPAGALLSAERVVLNFVSHLSGIATLASRYVSLVRQTGAKAQICDTRKTTPGWRQLEKFAVRCGGGVNHRMGLYDGVMLKDNHLATLRSKYGKNLSLAQITAEMKSKLSSEKTLWLEVDTLDQLAETLPGGGADIILLDNMSPEQISRAVALRNQHNPAGRPLLEASGGIIFDNVAAIAATGIDRISVGALTHSAPILDLSMEFENLYNV